MIPLLLSLATAGALTAIDLDGDGKDEAIKHTDDAVKIGKHTIDCFSEDGGMCEVHEVDITSADKNKDVVICYTGPRDQRSCMLYHLDGKELKRVEFGEYDEAAELKLTGSGFLYATNWAHRLYYRVDKYQWTDGKMVEVPQPIFTAAEPRSLHIEKTFALHFGPDSTELVGNAKPDSDIAILGEHGSKEGWMLVRLSSGITGYVSRDTLQEVSEHYMQVMSAG